LVEVPILLIGAEYDSIASTSMSAAAVRLFRWARYVEVQGANHYCLYDRPRLIARLIAAFVRNPADIREFHGEVQLRASSSFSVQQGRLATQ
jgi:hypothetical protein